MAAIDDTIREFTAKGKQVDTQLAGAAAPVPRGVISLSMSFQIGTPVLDLVSGLKGVVVDGKRENVIIPAAANNGS